MLQRAGTNNDTLKVYVEVVSGGECWQQELFVPASDKQLIVTCGEYVPGIAVAISGSWCA